MQVILACYLWDLLDEGIEPVLERLRGQVGVGGITVPATYHSVEQIRPHNHLSARLYRQPAAAYFQPDRSRYESTRIRPVVAEWLRSRNPLRDVARACAEAQMSLSAWIVCCHSSCLVQRYPAAGGKNVFGDPLPGVLCPANPDVRQYVQALVEDLSHNYSLEAVELDAACFQPGHAHYHRLSGLAEHCVAKLLWSMCFCESCRQAAIQSGLDIDAVARSVRVTLERWLAGSEPASASVQDYLARDHLLSDFLELRCRLIAEWIGLLRRACNCRLIYHAPQDPLLSAAEVSLIAPQVDAWLATCRSRAVEDVEATISRSAEALGATERLAVRFLCYPPACPDAPTLVRNVTRAAELGVGRLYLDNYGLIPEARLNWLRQAIRSARRACA